MRKILKKTDKWISGRFSGKIIVGCFALLGAISLVTAVVRYNHAYESMKDARWRTGQTAEKWRRYPISSDDIFNDSIKWMEWVKEISAGEGIEN